MVTFIENQNLFLRDVLEHQLSNSIEAYFALAFIRQSGVNMIIPYLEKFIQNTNEISILFANDFGATESEAIKTLRDLGVNLKFYSQSNLSFHIKSYIFKHLNHGEVIIGSSNLSASGLYSGKEWNVCIKSNLIDFGTVLKEFNILWESKYSRKITDELISKLEYQNRLNDVKINSQELDSYPDIISSNNYEILLKNSLNYIVTKKPSNQSNWFFQLYKSKIQRKSLEGDFNIVVKCDYQSSNEIIIIIPYMYLKKNILPFAHIEDNGRYLFNINKSSLVINWSRNVKIDGKKFIVNKKRT